MNQPGIMFGVIGGFLILVICLYKRQKIHANDIASLATTAGILFTFLGIVLALWDLTGLEDANVQEKIDGLLVGIYTAFIPSIFGAVIAVSTHVFPDFWHKPIDGPEPETDIDAQILQELRRLNTNIVGDNETSLVTRLEKFQLKVTENQDAMRKEFHDFAENVAQNIIEALKQSMGELNEKLGEQFGENFGRFADVIPKLLEWQEQYRETIENTQRQLEKQSDHMDELLESLERAQQAFAKIAEHAGNVANSANTIATTTPPIAASLIKATEGITQMRTDAEQFQKAAESLTKNIAQQTEQATKQMHALEQSAKSMEAVAGNAAILDDNARQLNTAISAMTSGLGAVTRLSDTLQGKADKIEQSMKDLTEDALRALAGNLRGISEALVEDYKTMHEFVKRIKGMGP